MTSGECERRGIAVPVGRLLPSNPFFEEGDAVCNVYKRLGVFDLDEEELCHKEIKDLICEIPGCGTQLKSVMELELHYNSIHRYTCATCRKSFASAHLLDLHIEESHDSYFAVQAERKPMYRCLVETCFERFSTSQERHGHCVDCHAFPTNFRWVTPKVSKPKPKKPKAPQRKTPINHGNNEDPASDARMDVDGATEVRPGAEPKAIRNFTFGRGNKKKSFNPRGVEWHQRHKTTPTASALESAQLSTDLMDSLP